MKVVAVLPKVYENGCNFKLYPYLAWLRCGGIGIHKHYPVKYLRVAIQHYDIVPSLWSSKSSAHLCFVQPLTLYYDTFSSVANHELIPLIWDCWPNYDEKLCKWILKHRIKTCIMTSVQAANRIKKRLPQLEMLTITEGIDIDSYPAGRALIDREIDVYTYGRQSGFVYKTDYSPLCFVRDGSDNEFKSRLQNSKITVAVPRCDVVPKQTGGQETLTQRYWECMLSRMVMVGRAPKELTELIGYNPVIEIDKDNYESQIRGIVSHIEDFQPLVDRNRETALKMGSWDIRMKQVMEWLKGLGYEV